MNHARNCRTCSMLGVRCVAVFVLACRVAAAAGQPPKPCEFFTSQAAEAIFGTPLDAGHDTELSCTYAGAGGDVQKSLIVNFIPSSSASPGMDMPETYDNLIHQDPTAAVVALSGLGDKADYITSNDGSEAAVEVLYHNSIVGIMATSSPNPRLKADLVQAVRQMIQKL